MRRVLSTVLLVSVLMVGLMVSRSTCQDLDIPCDIESSNDTCPDDYCCVRDEFLFSETYCKPFGRAGSPCSTKPSQFECPCEPGFHCASNIQGHITSLFGKCFPTTDITTDDTLTAVTSAEPKPDVATKTLESDSMTTNKDNRVNSGSSVKSTKGIIIG